MVLEAILPIFVELIITPVAEYVVTPTKRHLSYAFQSDSKVQNLEEAVVQLKNRKDRVENDVAQATRNGEEIYPNVTSWLSTASNDIDEAEVLIQGKEEAKKKRCVGVCPNLKTRYRLGKKADKKASEMEKLFQNAEKLTPISFRPPSEQIVEPSVFAQEALSSRLQILEQIMDALKDPQLNVIGVCGMGGVGKTTLAKEVQAKAMQEKMFDSVVRVAVSETPELKQIQSEIAGFLDLELKGEDAPVRASQLYKRLHKSKVLIILDDLWDELDLNAIGIPFGDSLKGCKLLLTSRSMDVLSIKMQTQKEFSLGVLGEEEAWALFQKMAPKSGDIRFHDIATKVSEKCAGLPLLIIIVAKELRNKELYAWEDMLKKLSVFGNDDIHIRVLRVLESSFENLPTEEIKSLFLLCSLFAQSNIQIQCLLIYGMGLGLFENTDTILEARNRLFNLIDKLKAECLLLDGDMDGFVKMHDVVRDAAVSIASRTQHAFVGAGQFRLVERLDQKKCTKISLPYCNVSELPGGLVCPEADLFLLFTEDLSLEMAASFFEGIRKLKAVGFTGMRFVSLPSSLGLLANLHTLSFHNCRLNNVAVIGELKRLELLSFTGSKIEKLPSEIEHLTQLKLLDLRDCTTLEELPREIEQLTQLKLLDLNNCRRLRVIPAGVFSKLHLLEELYVLTSFDQWDTKGNVSLAELENLSQLSTLEIQIVNPKLIPEGFRFFDGLKLQSFKISVGEWVWDGKYGTSKKLKLKLKPGVRIEHGIAVLLREAEVLYVDEARGINLDGESFPHLKHLSIKSDSDNIQYLVKSKASRQAFVILESLYLNGLKSLEMICDGQLATGSFGKLQKLNVGWCPKLRNVFSFSTAKCMYQLEEMKLYSCDNVEAIVGDGTEDGHYNNEVIEFTRLSSLKLRNFYHLRCFCEKEVGKPQIDSLFDEMVSFPNLTSLEVSNCQSLKYIFTSSVVVCLVQLKMLQIKKCESVEEIVLAKKLEEIKEDSMDKIAFPKLDNLNISELPNLKRFCHGHVIEFPSLKTLSLESCPAMQNFVSSSRNNNGSDGYFFNEMVALSNLESMDVTGMDDLTYLWDEKPIVNGSFFKLKSLTIGSCSKLHTIFPSKVYRRFLKLETLEVYYCDGVEEIYQNDGVDSVEENIEQPFALRDLRLSFLQSLKHIWSKDSGRAATFKSLQSVYVFYCENLKYVFPESIACDLMQLKLLEIRGSGVEMIIAKISKTSLEFPELTFLRLLELNELRSLYGGTHDTLELPKLKLLEFRSCGSEISPRLPLSSAEKLFMGVEKLKIDDHGFKSIGGGALPAEFFPRLKTVTVYSIQEESVRFLFDFLKRLRSVEKLVFERGYLEDISLFNDDDEQAAEEQQHYPRLKHLKLKSLDELKHIIKKGWQLNHVLQHLHTLTIKECDGLMDIALHSTSFQNLTTLYLCYCKNVTKLVTSSTAKTMVQLMRMKVDSCFKIEEIIANDSSSTEHDVINFSKLESLELLNLDRINSFCSGNHTIIFPLLTRVSVESCSEMMNFCGGVLSTPKLRGVLLNREQQWEGDLNVTISSHLRTWVGGRFEGGRLFQNVESLWVEKDALSSNAISANQLQFLNKLEKITVSECALVQAVFDLEGLSIEDGDVGFLLPQLEKLHLFNLPMLSKLCNRPPVGVLDLSKLELLKIENCGKSVHLQHLEDLLPPSAAFQNLTNLQVSKCDSLMNLITSSTARGLVQLKYVEVRECKMMQEIIVGGPDEADFEIRFSRLQNLVLVDLPCLESFSSGNNEFHFPTLEKVVVLGCPNMKNFACSVTPKLEKVKTGRRKQYIQEWYDRELNWECEWKWEGDLNNTIQAIHAEKVAEEMDSQNMSKK